MVPFHRLHQAIVERPEVEGRAERPVPRVAPGAARDLRDLGRAQRTRAAAVELAERGEGHVVDVEVEAHADGVGGHQVVHLARLVERDLRVARARGERAEHDGGSARLVPHALGHLVEVGQGEHDDRAPPRQPVQLLVPGVGEGGEPLARDEGRLGHELAQQGLDRLRAQEHRLREAPRAQQAVGEDVAALAVGGELDLVHGQELDPAVERHRLHRAHEVLRRGAERSAPRR